MTHHIARALVICLVALALLPALLGPADVRAQSPSMVPFEKPEWELTMEYPTGWTHTSAGGAELFVYKGADPGGSDAAAFSVKAGPELAGFSLTDARTMSTAGAQGPVTVEGPLLRFFGNVPALGASAVFTPTQASPDAAPLPVKAEIYVFDQGGLGYIFLALAPASGWDRHQAEFQAMFDSVKFPEIDLTELAFGTATALPAVAPTARATGTPLAAATRPAGPACRNSAAFVADVTVPDNTVFAPGAPFDKVWRVKNTGTCAWDAGQRLVFVSGEQMDAADSCPVSSVAAGATAELAVAMAAPEANGAYGGVWQMAGADGKAFGERFTVVIQVAAGGTPAATLPPALSGAVCGRAAVQTP